MSELKKTCPRCMIGELEKIAETQISQGRQEIFYKCKKCNKICARHIPSEWDTDISISEEEILYYAPRFLGCLYESYVIGSRQIKLRKMKSREFIIIFQAQVVGKTRLISVDLGLVKIKTDADIEGWATGDKEFDVWINAQNDFALGDIVEIHSFFCRACEVEMCEFIIHTK